MLVTEQALLRPERFWRKAVAGIRYGVASGGELRGRFGPEEPKAASRGQSQRTSSRQRATRLDHVSRVTFASLLSSLAGFSLLALVSVAQNATIDRRIHLSSDFLLKSCM